jgi:hypothetical protein
MIAHTWRFRLVVGSVLAFTWLKEVYIWPLLHWLLAIVSKALLMYLVAKAMSLPPILPYIIMFAWFLVMTLFTS